MVSVMSRIASASIGQRGATRSSDGDSFPSRSASAAEFAV
jgi:hypothetical protein